MDDEQLVSLALRLVEEKGLAVREELRKEDGGLYMVLIRRGLLDRVFPPPATHRSWKPMTDDEIVSHAREFVEDKRIERRTDLAEADGSLYTVLLERGLMGAVGLEVNARDWASMSDDEIVGLARDLIEKEQVASRTKLSRTDAGLYRILNIRGLMGAVGLEVNARDWASMSDDEIVEHVQRYMQENGIGHRHGLEKADRGLYFTLRRRGLLDRIGFEEKLRDWASMGGDELVEYAQEFIRKKGIVGRTELKEKDMGLYKALIKRGLLDRVGLEKKRIDWKLMSDEEIVEYALEIMKKENLTRRNELHKIDSGLYKALRRRELLDRVFAPIESQKKREAVQQVVDALKEFDLS